MYHSDLSLREVMGWTTEAPRQAWLALRGDRAVPGSKFGPTSLRQFTPRLALPTWLGRRVANRRVVVMNLFNHTQTPIERGWSVRITQVRDFRGRGLTYDSHNGTDFATPPGTTVVAAAPGRVVSLRSEYNRGGLKLAIDHGGGLLTQSNHLSRALVQLGDVVARGQPVALSGYSGLDALVSFPWVAPHVHYNVSLGGVLVDPFAHGPSALCLWRTSPPTPCAPIDDRSSVPTRFDAARVDALFASLIDDDRRRALASIADPSLRAWELVIESMTYPMRFSSPPAAASLFDDVQARATLDLPFSAEEIDGIEFADDLGLRRAPARA